MHILNDDPDDAPEWTEADFKHADLYHGSKLIRPGKGGPDRRVAEAIKQTRGSPPEEAGVRGKTAR
jgi:hypothetical protein